MFKNFFVLLSVYTLLATVTHAQDNQAPASPKFHCIPVQNTDLESFHIQKLDNGNVLYQRTDGITAELRKMRTTIRLNGITLTSYFGSDSSMYEHNVEYYLSSDLKLVAVDASIAHDFYYIFSCKAEDEKSFPLK